MGTIGCCGASGSTLTLTDLPPHQGLTIEFDLYIICTWDGNNPGGPLPDHFIFSIDGQPPLLNTTFGNVPGCTQYYPDGTLNPPGTGAAATNTLGYTAAMCGHTQFIEDSTYHLTFTIAHSGSQAVFQFGGGANQYCNDESWGLDNVSVTTIDAIPTVSEWGMMVMAGLVLAAGCMVIKRRQRAAA